MTQRDTAERIAGGDPLLAALARIEAGQREVLAELRRRRKAPRKRAASVARRALERVASLPVSELDVAKAASIMRRRGR